MRAEAWGRSMVLIALTGWGQEGDRRRSNEAGFDSHWVKPLDIELFTRYIEQLSEPAPKTGTRANGEAVADGCASGAPDLGGGRAQLWSRPRATVT